uniref:Soluble calciumactivated nucleotidase putative n=1 Tax=Albugo laibachii Nc14 TaxID=890382 RepID=F0WQC8_9STRA|nr:soluble calciumactivated nucleotidase putative [Albugo laibachii Nc14]|eukprot:CCA23536.1 soluble calciumactivated nucleotidase putative [Albugo laibachii Nc14]
MFPLRLDRVKRKTSEVETNMWTDEGAPKLPRSLQIARSVPNLNTINSDSEGISMPTLRRSNSSLSTSSPNNLEIFTRYRMCLIGLILAVVLILSLVSSNYFSLSSARKSPPFRSNNATYTDTNTSPGVSSISSSTVAAPSSRSRIPPVPLYGLTRPDSIGIVLVADLDKKSRDIKSEKLQFISYLQHATVKITKTASSIPQSTSLPEKQLSVVETYAVTWGPKYKFATAMNEAGRGCELSELVWFEHKLLTFDDRTGIMFEIKGYDGRKDVRLIPRNIVMERDGSSAKGQKHEWATVKDGELYMGSIGKEFTDSKGNILGNGFQWIAIMEANGNVRHEDWTGNFELIRKALGAEYPGYVVHEAVEWSNVHRQWFLLPRRVSTEAYSEGADEVRGSNKMVIASEDFSSIEIVQVGILTPSRGFSSFKFVPRTDDSIILAIKSEEIEKDDFQNSYISIFDIFGNIMLPETEVPGNHKYEGVAYTHDWVTLDRRSVL